MESAGGESAEGSGAAGSDDGSGESSCAEGEAQGPRPAVRALILQTHVELSALAVVGSAALCSWLRCLGEEGSWQVDGSGT